MSLSQRKLPTSPKCIERVLEKIPNVMLEELPDDLPLKKQVDHAIEVMPGVAPPAKAPYRMSHEELKELKVQLEESFIKGYIKPSKSPYGGPVPNESPEIARDGTHVTLRDFNFL
jgi:hypothetical protein